MHITKRKMESLNILETNLWAVLDRAY